METCKKKLQIWDERQTVWNFEGYEGEQVQVILTYSSYYTSPIFPYQQQFDNEQRVPGNECIPVW